MIGGFSIVFFFSSRRRHTRSLRDWSSDMCSSDLTWIPGRVLIDYVTGAALLVAGGSILLTRKTRIVATCVGGWILLMVLVIYGPVFIAALSEPSTGLQVEGINYRSEE